MAKGVQANWIHRGEKRPANPVRRHPAKSVWTRVRMIMILDVDVTAERRHYNTHRPLKGKRLTTFCASLRSGGPPIGGQDRDGASYRCSAPYTLSRFAGLPLKGKREIGGTGYCVTYDTDSQSRNVLASPLGEEGHEVAKGWTVVRMIMILDVDVTAERRHYNTHRPIGRYHNPRGQRTRQT